MAATPSSRAAMRAQQVSGNPAALPPSLAGSVSVHSNGVRLKSPDVHTDRNEIAKRWQIEAYRHVNICGEARYSATLFAAIAGRSEIGISEPQALRDKPTWVTDGPEVEVLAEIAPTVRERTRLVRDYMLHRIIAGECYLIARPRRTTDPGYVGPPTLDGEQFKTWDEYTAAYGEVVDLLDPDAPDAAQMPRDPNPDNPLWEVVAVTELRKNGDGRWQVRYDNGAYLDLDEGAPIIRMWNPDPQDRREAWSPFQAMLPTLREIEWLTKHIFAQVQSRLMSAGVWFLPDNLTFPEPPPEAVEGGAEAIAAMNDAERFLTAMAASSMRMLDADEVAFPTVVMSDAAALAQVDQTKLIKFWSEIDDKAMVLRSDAVRRFALGMDLPPEQVLGSSGLAVTGAGGSAGSVNHWGVWANEEQTISAHIEPALDDLVSVLTEVVRTVVEDSDKVVAYGTAALRLRQDRSKEAIELYDRGVIKAEVMVREVGFDPSNDMMDEAEHKMWLLNRIVSGQFLPEQMAAALALLGVDVPMPVVSGNPGQDRQIEAPKDRAGRDQPQPGGPPLRGASQGRPRAPPGPIQPF